MPVKFGLATSTQDIDSVFRLRHLVFAEQENKLQATEGKRLFDRFDAFPSTVQMMAQKQGQTIGAMRFSIDDVCGMPADEYFDFRPFLPEGAKAMHIGMFCVHKDFRGDKITQGLILMASYYAISNSVTHVVAPINPALALMLKRIGFKQVGELFYDPHIDHDVLPLLMEVSTLKDFFVDFVRANQLHDFIMDYQRWFFAAGETIVRAGTPGQEAFIIIDGTAEVKLPGTDNTLAILEAGEMFGELSIITEEERSADVVAKTDVQMMVMTRDTFMKRFVEDAENALTLMRMISRRSRSMVMSLSSANTHDSRLREVIG